MATSAPPASTSLQPQAPAIAERVYSVDLLRGVIMVIMALDHTREHLMNLPFVPENLARTWPLLFFTRWITHFCAPWFCFLAGTGAYLAMSRGKALTQVRSLLWKRGVFLIVFEWTVMMFALTFIPLPMPIALILWALGWSMIALVPLTYLPLKWIAAFSIALMALHNLADPIRPAAFGRFAWLWQILHVQGAIVSNPPHVLFGKIPVMFVVAYPLLPWPAVMAAGYAFGAVMKKPAAERRRIMLWLGAACIALFIVLRATNVYGNPNQPGTTGDFHAQSRLSMSIVSFLDTQKYPPSLDFLLMTLGPGFLALAAFDRMKTGRRLKTEPLKTDDVKTDALAGGHSRPDIGLKSLGPFFLVYGRVPMFYYALHIFLIHLLAIAVALLTRQPARWLLNGGILLNQAPKNYGHGLAVVYAVWIGAVLLLYLPCRWYMELKRRRRDWWMQYI